jgi:hypothetical protein
MHLQAVNNARILLGQLLPEELPASASITPTSTGGISVSWGAFSVRLHGDGTIVLVHAGKATELVFDRDSELLISEIRNNALLWRASLVCSWLSMVVDLFTRMPSCRKIPALLLYVGLVIG